MVPQQVSCLVVLVLSGCSILPPTERPAANGTIDRWQVSCSNTGVERRLLEKNLRLTDKSQLEQDAVARQKGTERPFSSAFETSKEVGTYHCVACGNPLFKSDTKFDSGCGWPSFFDPITKGAIIYTPDNTHGMTRTEVQCGKCKGHLGHVFEDGPPPTGLRYCINGVVLALEKK